MQAEYESTAVLSQPRPIQGRSATALHQAAMHAAQAKLFLARAMVVTRSAKARRVLQLLIDGLQLSVGAVERLRTGGDGAL